MAKDNPMLKFYYNLSPNPMKVALLLEELEVAYEPVTVDALLGQQFAPTFLRLNPNGKVPVIVDDGTVVFDSNAVLLYLAERSGGFLPPVMDRGDLLSWLTFIATGVGPFFGQAVHFRHFAPRASDYAARRYAFEAQRHLEVLDGRLNDREWLVGDEYSIVDMAAWAWLQNTDFVIGQDALNSFPHVARLVSRINERPATDRVKALRDRGGFKQSFDADARSYMFRHNQPASSLVD